MTSEQGQEPRKVKFSTPDNWILIEHFGRIQSSNPLRSIKELVDNAIDAFARDPSFTPPRGKVVRVEISKSRSTLDHIRIVDNALGWECDPTSGLPNFEYSVGHIGDSIKKYIEEYRKAHEEGKSSGQYALGLLSFWAIGNRLTVFSRCLGHDGKLGACSKMVWLRFEREAAIVDKVAPPAELAQSSGCVVIVDQLEKARMTQLVTGPNVQKYLARACRPRLMKTGVNLEILYQNKRYIVEPMKYEGTHFPLDKFHIEKAFGTIELEIYLFPPAIDPDEYKVPVFRKGSKVYDDITQIEELDVYPWNANKVYGQIDYPWGTMTPSRNAFVNDNFLDAFITAMKGITQTLTKQIEEIESRRRKWQQRRFYDAFEKTWEAILSKLPDEWQRKKKGALTDREKTEKPKVEPGPVYRLEISPQDTQVQCGMMQPFTAKAYDKNENLVTDPNMIYYWKFEPSIAGLLTKDQFKTCMFQAGKKEGLIAVMTATAFQYIEESGEEKTIAKTASTNVWIVSQLTKKPPQPPRGDKPPIPDEIPLGNEIHSKYLPKMNVIQVNIEHKDFKAARERGPEALYRYINYCYCKEIAVDRWKDLVTDAHELSERITDLLAISELAFDWKELAQKPRGRPPKASQEPDTSQQILQ